MLVVSQRPGQETRFRKPMFFLLGLVDAAVGIVAKPFMKPIVADRVRRYGLAVVAVLSAVSIRLLLKPVLGAEPMPYITLLLAIVFCAAYCGVGPSILALVLAEFAAFYFFSAPVFTFRLQHPLLQVGGMALFAITSGFVIWMGESKRRALANTEQRIREATAELSALTASLLRSQDDERRHLARELHDNAGQLLAAISINLDVLRSRGLSPETAAMVADTSSLVRETSRQIRTLSHLLHPPLLEEVGLLSALQSCVRGFSDRSKIPVTLDIKGALGRYDQNVEIAVFRVVQECLTNIHQHSGSSKAAVKLFEEEEGLKVVVQDNGKGIPAEKLNGSDIRLGIGLLGMKQRISQLDGDFAITSNATGTVVAVRLPVHPLGRPVRPENLELQPQHANERSRSELRGVK